MPRDIEVRECLESACDRYISVVATFLIKPEIPFSPYCVLIVRYKEKGGLFNHSNNNNNNQV